MTTLSTQQLHDEWERQYVDEALPAAKIAARYGVAKFTVLKALHARGVVRNSRGPRVCSEPECREAARTRGRCPKHYQRWLTHGTAAQPVAGPDTVPGETWLPVTDAPGYLVSNLGRVYSLPRTVADHRGQERTLRGRQLRLSDALGYSAVTLRVGGIGLRRRVHRLVALAFLGDPGDGYEVNHIDGDKQNNRLDNLEWVTPSENSIHGFELGLMPRGSAHMSAKLAEQQVRQIRKRLAAGARPGELAAEYGVSIGAIYGIRSRRSWAWLD